MQYKTCFLDANSSCLQRYSIRDKLLLSSSPSQKIVLIPPFDPSVYFRSRQKYLIKGFLPLVNQRSIRNCLPRWSLLSRQTKLSVSK